MDIFVDVRLSYNTGVGSVNNHLFLLEDGAIGVKYSHLLYTVYTEMCFGQHQALSHQLHMLSKQPCIASVLEVPAS